MNVAIDRRGSALGGTLILLLALLTALDAMAIDMYLPGMPDIAAEFGVSAGRVQQTLAVFLAGLAIGQGVYGPLLDRFGRRVPLLAGVVVFVLGSMLGALAPSIEWLLAARFIQALGAAAGLVTPRAIVTDSCGLTESARIFSLLMQVMMIAPIVAPLLGGYLLGQGGWRVIFWVLAALGVAGLIWGWRAIPDSLPHHSRAPLRLRHIMTTYGRQSRDGVFMAYTGCGGFALSALFVYISGSAFVFTEHFGLSAEQFSYVFAGNSVSLVLGGMISNFLLGRGLSARHVLIVGLMLHSLAAWVLFFLAQAAVADLVIYTALLAMVIGSLGLVFGNVTALTMNRAGTQAGTASALMGMLHYLLSAVVGYSVTFTASGAGQLPLAVGVCSLMALSCCWLAQQGGATMVQAAGRHRG